MTSWEPVTGGLSGARVWRSGGLFRKAGHPAVIAAEADRLTWLAGHDIPCARVVSVSDGVLTTTAVPGRPAAELVSAGSAVRDRAVSSFAALARALHALPARDCPFRRPLDQAVAEAEAAVAAGAVDLDNLDDERHGWSAQRLLGELHRTRPATTDPVVCHGDLTLDNILVDDTGTVTGVVDVGGLAVADRCQDLALLSRDLLDWSPSHGERFLTAYGPPVDRSSLAFYRLLDEFF